MVIIMPPEFLKASASSVGLGPPIGSPLMPATTMTCLCVGIGDSLNNCTAVEIPLEIARLD